LTAWTKLLSGVRSKKTNNLTDVREFYRVLYEEDWYVVSNNVPIAFFCIKLDSKATDISNCVGTATVALDGGKPQKDRGLSRGIRQHRCKRNVLRAFEKRKFSESSRSPSVNNSLRNTFMIEAMNLRNGLDVRTLTKFVVLAFSLAC
jgi:hypothetical protein